MHDMIKAHGLDTYDILKNEKYYPLILALDSAAEKVSKMKSKEDSQADIQDSAEINSQTDMKEHNVSLNKSDKSGDVELRKNA